MVAGNVPERLRAFFEENPKVALGFSGGVDSAYLLYAARAAGADVMPYFVHSCFQPRFELEDAQRLCDELAVKLSVLDVNILKNEMVKVNLADRCYHCKRSIFARIAAQAAADGYSLLMDGSNASDDAKERPGMRAIAELQVRSPLRETGMTKVDIRASSRSAGLFTWDKPAYACLATRVPTGVSLDEDTLAKVETAEARLAAMGFRDFRARVLGDGVKLQFPADQIPLAASRSVELMEALSPYFVDVLLDLRPR